jgi:hypothetical protein
MPCSVELVDRHPILEVAVEPVGLLDQHHAHCRMRLQIGHHLAEAGAASLLGRLHVHIFLHSRETISDGIFLKELQLRRDREALFFLFLRRDAGVDDRLLASFISGRQF